MKYLAALAIAIIMPSVSVAADYVAVDIGTNKWPRTSNDDELEASTSWEPALMVASGWHLSPRMRSEVELSYRRQETHGANYGKIAGPRIHADGNRVHGASVHANLEYDVWRGKRFSGYVMGGVGVTYMLVRHEYSHRLPFMVEINGSDWAPSAQIGMGLRYDLSQNTALDFGARYLRPMNMEIEWQGHDLRADFDAYTLTAGVAFSW